jgi:hypothetical protein
MKSIIDFIENNVNGRNLYTEELLYDLENKTLQGVYSDQISFSNLKYSKSTFQLDMFIIANEKIYYRGECEHRGALQTDYSAVSLFRYELALRKSTGNITGLFRFISASGKNITSEAIVSGIYDVRLKNGILTMKEDQALYRDQPKQDGNFKAVAFMSDHRFFIQDEKLHYEYNGKNFHVDTETMQRCESTDHYPHFTSVQK